MSHEQQNKKAIMKIFKGRSLQNASRNKKRERRNFSTSPSKQMPHHPAPKKKQDDKHY